MKGFFLSEQDVLVLKEVVKEYRHRNRGFEESPHTPARHPFAIEEMAGYPPDDIFPPEVYIAEIPEAGIPAMTLTEGDYIPGHAECDIYKLWPISNEEAAEEELVTTHFTHEVYNIYTSSVNRVGNARFQIVWRDKFGRWLVHKGGSGALVELCAQEDAERNVPYTALLGTWDEDQQIWCYDNAETVYAIDHRIGAPYAEIGWKGLYQEMPSSDQYHNGRIFVCVSLDCELPPEGCNECEEQ